MTVLLFISIDPDPDHIHLFTLGSSFNRITVPISRVRSLLVPKTMAVAIVTDKESAPAETLREVGATLSKASFQGIEARLISKSR